MLKLGSGVMPRIIDDEFRAECMSRSWRARETISLFALLRFASILKTLSRPISDALTREIASAAADCLVFKIQGLGLQEIGVDARNLKRCRRLFGV